MNKLQSLVAKLMQKNDPIFKRIYKDISGKITIATSDTEIISIVHAAYKRAGLEKEFFASLESSTVAAAEIGGVEKVASFKKWFLEKSPLTAGVAKIGKNYGKNRAAEIITDIRESMKAGRSWSSMARKLHDNVGVKADVAGDIQSVLREARKVYGLTDDTKGYQAYRAEVMRVQRRVDRMVDPDTSMLKKAYQNVLDLTNKSTAKQLDNAIERATYAKERYNAERIARTEMGRAYGDAAFSDAIQDQDAIGVQFILSSGHDVADQCDFVCGADLYGMGKGVYPKEYAPEFPIHPQCLCSIVKVYQGEAPENGKADFDPKAGEKYLKGISEDKRKAIIGASASPDEWQAALDKKGFVQEEKTVVIPKKYLTGG